MQTIRRKQWLPAASALLALLWTTFTPVGGEPTSWAGNSKLSLPKSALLLAGAGFETGALQPLIGRWRRPDGGYILEIRNAAPDGKLEAYYFNPRSINVHRAEASRTESEIKLVVELRDAGYPGSTYALLYRPDKDILAGYYYQAGQRQYFEVLFVRQHAQ